MSSISIPILLNEKVHKTFKAGETIFAAGDNADFMYGVTEGEIEIRMGDRPVEVVQQGGIFGEVALVDSMPRSATAVALTDVTVVIINSHRFMQIVAQNPWFSLQVMHVLTERLRRWGN